MPRLETYEAPDRPLRPSAEGIDAFTRSGRYMGQYRRQTAQDMRDLGVLQSQELKDRGWPFDILALEQQMQKDDKGVAFKVQGGVDNISSMSGGRVSGRADNSGDLAAHGVASRGAGALGRAASRMTARNPDGTVFNQQGEQTIDTTTGLPIRPYTAKQAAQLNAARDKYNTQQNVEDAAVAQEFYKRGNPGEPNNGQQGQDFRFDTGYRAPPPIPGDPNAPPAPDVFDKIYDATQGGNWQPEGAGLRDWLRGPENQDVTEGREGEGGAPLLPTGRDGADYQ